MSRAASTKSDPAFASYSASAATAMMGGACAKFRTAAVNSPVRSILRSVKRTSTTSARRQSSARGRLSQSASSRSGQPRANWMARRDKASSSTTRTRTMPCSMSSKPDLDWTEWVRVSTAAATVLSAEGVTLELSLDMVMNCLARAETNPVRTFEFELKKLRRRFRTCSCMRSRAAPRSGPAVEKKVWKDSESCLTIAAASSFSAGAVTWLGGGAGGAVVRRTDSADRLTEAALAAGRLATVSAIGCGSETPLRAALTALTTSTTAVGVF